MKLSARLPIGTVLALLLASSPCVLRAQWSTQHTFILEQLEATRGQTIILPVRAQSTMPIEGITFAVIFNARQLDLVSVTPVAPTASGWDVFDVQRIDRDNAVSWRDDVYGRVVFDEDDPQAFYPAGGIHEVLRLEFRVRDDAEQGPATVKFHNLYVNESDPGSVDWENAVLSGGQTHQAFCNHIACSGGIFVDPPQGIPFLRGDVNFDGEVSISDAAMLRRSIFFGTVSGDCEEAGDVDDNGHRDLTDAVRLMIHVIQTPPGESLIAPPYPEIGLDTTADAIYCSSYLPLPPDETDDLVRLESLEAAPGEEVEVPIHVTSSADVEAYQLIVTYDPSVFTLVSGPRKLDLTGTSLEESGGGFNAVSVFEEGMALIGIVGHLVEDGFEIPAGEDVLAGKLRGVVSPDAVPGTEVRFDLTNGPNGEGVGEKRLRNELTHEGEARLVTVIPRLEGMVLGIVSDVTFFRGDSNGDSNVDIADAVFTLNHLFSSEAALVCPDAADADDSGIIDITDPILTLGYLFQGSKAPAAPHPRRGSDREPDELPGCRP